MTQPPPVPSISVLIETPKSVARILRTRNADPEHARLNIELATTTTTPGTFHVFVRVLRALGENFSIGLRFATPAGDTVLLRVNGDHGGHKNPDGGLIPDGPHVHSFRPPQRQTAPRPSAEAKWAWPVPSDHLALPVAWRTFCRLANITSSSNLDRRIEKLYASYAPPSPSPQLALPLQKP